ncbi:MAG: hypothetical protein LLF94_05825 [Chlamydiales bacterium]|nr:hypothetical protein [Chlamydiales bacterium]
MIAQHAIQTAAYAIKEMPLRLVSSSSKGRYKQDNSKRHVAKQANVVDDEIVYIEGNISVAF